MHSIASRCAAHAASAILAVSLALSVCAIADAQIFTANTQVFGVGKYTLAGATISHSFVTGIDSCNGITVADGFLYATSYSNGTVGKYDATTGATINANLITGLANPAEIAVFNGNLYIVSAGQGNGTGKIGIYSQNGQPINPSLVTGLNVPYGLSIGGQNIYVTLQGSNTAAKYDLLSGAPISVPLIAGLNNPLGIAVSDDGTKLFVVNNGPSVNHGSIGEYNPLTGAAINAALITNLQEPEGLRLVNEHLFVANGGPFNNGTVGEYSVSGATINSARLSGLPGASDVEVVPEPSALALSVAVLISSLPFALVVRKRRRSLR